MTISNSYLQMMSERERDIEEKVVRKVETNHKRKKENEWLDRHGEELLRKECLRGKKDGKAEVTEEIKRKLEVELRPAVEKRLRSSMEKEIRNKILFELKGQK